MMLLTHNDNLRHTDVLLKVSVYVFGCLVSVRSQSKSRMHLSPHREEHDYRQRSLIVLIVSLHSVPWQHEEYMSKGATLTSTESGSLNDYAKVTKE